MQENHLVSRDLTCKVKDGRDYSMVILLSVTLLSHYQVRSINKRCHSANARQLQYSKLFLSLSLKWPEETRPKQGQGWVKKKLKNCLFSNTQEFNIIFS